MLCVVRDYLEKGATKGTNMKVTLDIVKVQRREAHAEKVVMKLDFVGLNDSINFVLLRNEDRSGSGEEHQAVLFRWVGKTCLINNLSEEILDLSFASVTV